MYPDLSNTIHPGRLSIISSVQDYQKIPPCLYLQNLFLPCSEQKASQHTAMITSSAYQTFLYFTLPYIKNHIFLHISTTCLLYLVLLHACPTPNFTSSFILPIVLARAFHLPVKQFSSPLATSKPPSASSIFIFSLMGYVCLITSRQHSKAHFSCSSSSH